MKTLQVSGIRPWGGGEQQLLFLCEELKSNYPEIENVVFCPYGAVLVEHLQRRNIQVYNPKLAIKTSPTFFMKLGHYCKKHNIDVVHAHDPIAMFLVILASFFYKMPRCIYSKKTSFPIKQRAKTLFKYNHKIFQKIICVSNAVKKETALAVEDTSKLVTIYDGIEPTILQNTPRVNIKDILKLDATTRIILNIGNHTKPKDLSTFIKTANEVLKTTEQVHFVQIGRYTEHSQPLLDLVKTLGLNNNMSFLGELEHASNVLTQAAVFLHTSKTEGLGQVILEAMLHETPIVSTAVGGIPEIIESGKNGLLSPAGDYKGLAMHVCRVLDGTLNTATLVKGNAALVRSTFSKAVMAKNTVALYETVQYLNR